MEPIPAAALPIVVATDAQPVREAGAGDASDLSAFGQALEKELSAVSAETAEAPDPGAAVLASSDVVARSDGTQMLDVILDSTGMLASAAAAAAAAATQGAETLASPADLPIQTAAEAALKSARAPRLADYVRDNAGPELPAESSGRTPAVTDASTTQAHAAAPTTIDMRANVSEIELGTREQRGAASRFPTPPQDIAAAAAAALALSDKALETVRTLASGGPGPTPEMPASLEKTRAPAITAERAGAQRPGSVQADRLNTLREEPQTRSLSDDLLASRTELRTERTGLEAASPSARAATVPAPDPSLQPREITMQLDALSSATLIHRAAQTSHHASASSTAPAVVRVDTPLATPGWSEAFRHQVVWLVDRQLETAELHVNPPHLGPVEVVLKISDDGARIAFCSPHAAVREAIEASLPDLRSGLAERGLALGEALVSADPGSAREQMMRDEDVRGAPRISDVARGEAEPEVHVLPLRRGLIDTFV
jgi:flagellar hook-length control protein FliK